jgi:septum site-determining protein MinC
MSSTEVLPMKIKANRDGFVLVPDEKASFQSIMSFMEQRLTESRDFFHDSEMVLDLRARTLGTDEILSLHSLLVEKAMVRLVEVRLSDDMALSCDPRPPKQEVSAKPAGTLPSDQIPLIIRSTCRSGMRVESLSDCVVLGDVNPGAEIIAVGDVIIFGSLRGIAHAGAQGDRSARIWALGIQPSQIRIADLVALPPRGSKPTPRRFEIAEIQDNQIEVITV